MVDILMGNAGVASAEGGGRVAEAKGKCWGSMIDAEGLPGRLSTVVETRQ